jgi:putative ABC transport system permease protein
MEEHPDTESAQIWWDNLSSDLRHGVRVLLKTPGLTLAVLVALALGIGANSAIFTVINTVLLHPLPYPHSDRIVNIARSGGGGVTVPMFTFLEQNSGRFEDIAAYQPGIGMNLEGSDKPELVNVIKVSRNYFQLFGAKPVIGRTFSEEEDLPSGPQVLILSYRLWRRRFAGTSSVVHKSITLGGASYAVIGVLSPSFKPNPPADVWIPLQADAHSTDEAHVLVVAARLPPSGTPSETNSWAAALGRRYVETHPHQFGRDEKIQVTLMQQQVTGDVRPTLLLLMGAVGLVLVIACANVANLLLARSTGRQKEIAIRAAIGAGRGRIVRQLLTESLLLAFAGGALGLVIGSLGVRVLLDLTPSDLPRIQEMSSLPALDPWVAGFTILLAVATGIVFGLIPAVELSHPELVSSLKESSPSTGTGLKHSRTRSTLVSAEIAIAVVLSCGAALLIRSFAAMHATNLGFNPQNLLTMQVSLAGPGYSRSGEVDRIAREFVERAERIPGVESAAMASALPLWGRQDMVFDIPRRAPLEGLGFTGDVQWRFVSPHYFNVLGIPLISGTLPGEHLSGRTVVVSQAMARKFWPNEDPVGQTILIGHRLGRGFDQGPVEIVGVVGDVRERLEFGPTPIMYESPSEIPDGAMVLMNRELDAILIRTAPRVGPMTVSEAVRQTLIAIANVPATNVRTMEQVSLDSTARQNFNLLLLSLFAAIALLLAAVGIYSVMSYSVARRTHEFGVRAALGATPSDTLALVLTQALRMTAAGVALGLAAAFGLTRLLAAQLYSVKSSDPLTLTVVPAILVAVALAAACIPALRASRLDPIVALRNE